MSVIEEFIQNYADELADLVNDYTIDLMISGGVVLGPNPSRFAVFAAMADMEKRGYFLEMYERKPSDFDVLFHRAIALRHHNSFIKGYEIIGSISEDDEGGYISNFTVKEV